MSNSPSSTSSTLVRPTLLPRFVSNTFETANVLSDAMLRGAQGCNRAVAGIDEIATLMLRQQQERLLAELGSRQKAIALT